MSTEDDYPDDEALLALRLARIEELETAIERAIRSLDVAETGGDAQEVSDRLRRLLAEDGEQP